MKRLLSLLKWDYTLQLRYRIIASAFIAAIFSLVVIKLIPRPVVSSYLPILLLCDPAIVGFYFLGILIFFERSERTLEALLITPLRLKEYFISKTITLAVIAYFISLIFVIAGYGIVLPGSYLALSLGVILSAIFFILIGFSAVIRVQSFNVYLVTSLFYFLFLFIPFFDYFGLYSNWIFYLFPTQASLLLLRAGFEPIQNWQYLYSLLYLLFWIGILAVWAYRSFHQYIVLQSRQVS